MVEIRNRNRWFPVLMCCLFLAVPRLAASDGSTDDESEPEWIGPLTRSEVEVAMPDWVVAEMEAEPDLQAAEALIVALEGAEVSVFFGTWCSDSGRELPRLWRAFDDLGVMHPDEIRYIGVDRSKTEPREWLDGLELQLVPTFVVRRDGQEVGRVVESSPNGIERDLLALLRGDKIGVISDSDDLEITGEER